MVAKESTKSGTTSTMSSLGGMTSFIEDLLGSTHSDTPEFEEAVKKCIPSEFLLIASQDDYTQAQEDYFAMDHFKLGKHVPKYVQKANAGSVATCALLQLMYENPKLLVADNLKPGDEPINCLQLSRELKKRVKDATKLEAKPTISSSRPLGPPRLEKAPPFFVVPPGYTGTRRALLIGVVAGEGDDLKGPPNDVTNIQQFLTKHCGFEAKNITVLQDFYKSPSAKESFRKNILAAFENLVKLSKPKDVCFIQFSGHGGRVGNNLYILPSDYAKAGQIMDELILRDLIKKMPAKVYSTMLVDCCYSGTVGDLPYILEHNTSGKQKIDAYYDTDMRKEMIQKEKEGGQDYQLYKQARNQRRLETRISGVVDFVTASAAAGFDATAAAAKKGYDATTMVAQAGLDATTKMAHSGYDVTAKAAHAGYDTTANLAHAGYDTTANLAHAGYDKTAEAAAFTTKTAGETGQKAAALLMTTGKGATDVSKQAAHAMTESGKNATKTVGESGQKAAALLKTTGKGATDASKQAAQAMTETGKSAASAVTKSGASAVTVARSALNFSGASKSSEGDLGGSSAKSQDDAKGSKFGISSLVGAASSVATAATSTANSAANAATSAANTAGSSFQKTGLSSFNPLGKSGSKGKGS